MSRAARFGSSILVLALALTRMVMAPAAEAVSYTCGLTAACATVVVHLAGDGSGTIVSNTTKTATGLPTSLQCSYPSGMPSGTCSLIFRWLPALGTPDLYLTLTPDQGSCGYWQGSTPCGPGTSQQAWTQPLTASTTIDVYGTMALTNRTLEITSTGVGTGTVSVAYAGMTQPCTFPGSKCEITATYGTAVTLSAVADAGAAFDGWTGQCGGQTATCHMTLISAGPVFTVSTNVVFGLPAPSPSAPAAGTQNPTGHPGSTPKTTPVSTSRPGSGASPSLPAASPAETSTGAPSFVTPGVTAPGSAGPSPSASAAPSPVSTGGDSTPWLAVVAIVVLIVVGVNVGLYQVLRIRRPRA